MLFEIEVTHVHGTDLAILLLKFAPLRTILVVLGAIQVAQIEVLLTQALVSMNFTLGVARVPGGLQEFFETPNCQPVVHSFLVATSQAFHRELLVI